MASPLLVILERIAVALEESNHHSEEYRAAQEESNRLIAEHSDLQRRSLEAAELHNTLHLAGKAHQPQPS